MSKSEQESMRAFGDLTPYEKILAIMSTSFVPISLELCASIAKVNLDALQSQEREGLRQFLDEFKSLIQDLGDTDLDNEHFITSSSKRGLLRKCGPVLNADLVAELTERRASFKRRQEEQLRSLRVSKAEVSGIIALDLSRGVEDDV